MHPGQFQKFLIFPEMALVLTALGAQIENRSAPDEPRQSGRAAND